MKTKSLPLNRLTTMFLILTLILGLGMLAYPAISRNYNRNHQTRVIGAYTEAVEQISDMTERLEAARNWNANLLTMGDRRYFLNDEEKATYQNLLSFTEDGMIGHLYIEKTGEDLPIYHGSDETVLQSGIGHVSGTSLPVGGAGTHALLTGHTGMISQELFTGLDTLEMGDQFLVNVADQRMTYEVIEIQTVLPEETQSLQIEEGRDLVTLATCTPYGVNSHRLLVTGERCEEELISDPIDSGVVSTGFPWWILIVGFVGLMTLVILCKRRKKAVKTLD